HEVNEIKVGKLPGFEQGYRLASESEIETSFGCTPGYLGPINPRDSVRIIADTTVANMHDFICGANETGYHYTGVNWERDLPEPEVADIRNVVAGDPHPEGGTLAIEKGIEVGHVFFLGDEYSRKLGATYLDKDGKPIILQMGCYGIGVSRIAAAAIEQNHDSKGIIWPANMAPYQVVICPIAWSRSELVRQTATELYQALQQRHIEVILDDRDLRPGTMFADWELIGIPWRITIGERNLKQGRIEFQHRRDSESTACPVDEVLEQIETSLS